MDQSEPPLGYQLSAVLIVLVFSAIGGMGVHFATQGFNPPGDSSLKHLKLVPLINGFIFPTIVAQLLWGALAYNGFSNFFDLYYRDVWGKWIRNICTAPILLRAGIELELEAKGLKFLFFSFIPAACEAGVVALLAHFLMDFHWEFALALGFLNSALAPAVLFPVISKLRTKNYSLGVNAMLFSSSGFMVGFSLILYSACNSIGLINLGSPGSSITNLITRILTQIFAGLGMPLVLANLLRVLKGKSEMLKALGILFLLEFHMWFFTYFEMPEGAVISQMFFGYRAKVTFEGKVPNSQLNNIWYFCMPFLFGHVGCQFDLRSISWEIVGVSLIGVVLGMLVRAITCLFSTKLVLQTTLKERIFMGIAVNCKLALQCSYGGKLLSITNSTPSLAFLKKESVDFLTSTLICAIFGGIVCSMLLENLGSRLLILKQEKGPPDSTGPQIFNTEAQPVLQKAGSDLS